MKCTGRVLENLGDRARVLLEKDACGECHACGIASMREPKPLEVVALNNIGAREGDLVAMEVSGRRVVMASAILFLLPLAAFLAGFALPYFLVSALGLTDHRTAVSLFCGLAALCASYLLVRYLGNRLDDFEFVITALEQAQTIPGEEGQAETTDPPRGKGAPL